MGDRGRGKKKERMRPTKSLMVKPRKQHVGTKKIFSQVPPSLTAPPTDTTKSVRTGKQEMVTVKTRKMVTNSILILLAISTRLLFLSGGSGGGGSSGSDSGQGVVEHKIEYCRTYLLLTM